MQQQVAQDLLDAFPALEDNDVRSVSMGVSGEDIVLSPLAESMFPFSIECKNVEKLNVWNAIEQSGANATRGKTPIVVIKKNRTSPHVILSWVSFLKILTGANANDSKPDHPEGGGRGVSNEDVHNALQYIEKATKLLQQPASSH